MVLQSLQTPTHCVPHTHTTGPLLYNVALVVKNLPANAGDAKRLRFDFWVEKIPWKRAWQPTPVFLSGESHGERNLAGYNPLGRKELDMTEAS